MEKDTSGSWWNPHFLDQGDLQSNFARSAWPTIHQTIRETRCWYAFALLSILILGIFAPTISAQVLINEVDADQEGTDDAEFVELFDGGAGNTDLSGLVLVFFNGRNDTTYKAFDLDGFSTNSTGYFVLCGNKEMVTNCDSDVSPNINLIQNGADAIALYTDDAVNFPRGTSSTLTNLIDAIVYGTDNQDDDAGLLQLLIPNQPQVNENGLQTATMHSNQRCPNGAGGARRTDTYAQFAPTAGTNNICGATVNTAPTTVGSIEALILMAGTTDSRNIATHFHDPEGDPLTYTASSSGSDTVTVIVSGSMVMVTAVAEGTATITVTATDTHNPPITQTFAITVNPVLNTAPTTVGSIEALMLTAGTIGSRDIAIHFHDPEGDPLTYTASSSGSDTVTVIVSGSMVTVTAVAEGTATITVTATDTHNPPITQTFAITVNPVLNTAPTTVGSIEALMLTAGTIGSRDIAIHFHDPEGDPLTYTASSSGSDTVTVIVSGSMVTVTAVAEGTATITVTATDTHNPPITQTFAITVNPVLNTAPTTVGSIEALILMAGTTDSRNIATHFHDPEGDPLTYTASSSGSDTVTVIVSGSMVMVTAVAEGTATITVTATDTHNPPITQTFAITVNAAPKAQETIEQLNEDILPRLVQVAVASTLASLGNRIDITFSGIPQTASYQLDGQRTQLDGKATLSDSLQQTLLHKLPTHSHALQNATLDWKRMSANSSFALPLHATAANADDNGNNLAVWGSGDYRKLSGDSNDIDWRGDVVNLQLGMDNRVGRDLLVGGLVSWSEGKTDYTLQDPSSKSGKYQHTLTSIHPYLAWSNETLNLWGSVGYGQGTLEYKETASETSNIDTRLLSVAGGIKGAVLQQSGISIKNDFSLVRTDIDAEGKNPKQTINSQRLRLLLEVDQEQIVMANSILTPAIEIGVRYDAGDGDKGLGAVLGAKVRYANNSDLTAEGKVHALIGHNNYKEWGIQGVIRQETATNGQGLFFSLSPIYGNSLSTSSADTLWQQPPTDNSNGNSHTDYSAQIEARVGYGLSVPGGRGLLTPYTEITLGNTTDRYCLGLRWKHHSRLEMNLFGEEQADKYTVLLESRLHF